MKGQGFLRRFGYARSGIAVAFRRERSMRTHGAAVVATILGDAQLKQQMNRIIEHRDDGLTFHYKAIDEVRADGQQLVNQALGGILQDSINEMGAKAITNGGGNSLQGILGNLGGLQTAVQNEWNNQQQDFQQFGKSVCARVISLEDQRKALTATLK